VPQGKNKVQDKDLPAGITLFTIPKAFQGHNNIIQLNAVRSWMSLRPRCEIIFLGNDAGTSDLAAELGISHYPDIDCNEYGTPLISSIFSQATKYSRTDTMCYINADIILLNDFLPSVRRVLRKRFLIVGRRWDLDIDELINYNDPDWEKQLRERVRKNGVLHASSGIDYFCFPKGLYEDIPPFAIGRGSWDNWLLFRARQLKTPIIDATAAITAIHENHDYSHLKDGANHFTKGIEMKPNLEMAGGVNHLFSLDYATHLLTGQGVKTALTPRHIYYRLAALPVLHRHLSFLTRPMKSLTRFLGSIRSNTKTA
jgi:hypothetical protein